MRSARLLLTLPLFVIACSTTSPDDSQEISTYWTTWSAENGAWVNGLESLDGGRVRACIQTRDAQGGVLPTQFQEYSEKGILESAWSPSVPSGVSILGTTATEAGYLAYGARESRGQDLFFAKLDRNLQPVWHSTLDFYPDETLVDGLPTTEGYLFLGYEWSGFFSAKIRLVLLSQEGELLNNQLFDKSSYQYGAKLIRTGSGKIFVIGTIKSLETGDRGILILEISEMGEIVGSVEHFFEDSCNAYDAFVSSVGGFYVGFSQDMDTEPSPRFGLARFDAEGGMEWMRSYDDTGGILLGACTALHEGGVLMAGLHVEGEGYPDIETELLLLAVDEEGSELWRRRHRKEPDLGYFIGEIVACTDGGYALTASISPLDFLEPSKALILKVDGEGRGPDSEVGASARH